MSDLFAHNIKPTTNIVELTVSELSSALKKTIEDAFGQVRIRGEISNYRGPHASGHAYFSLKDDKARIEAVIWRGQMSKLTFQPEEGVEVIALGRLTTYPGSSKYQIVIDALEPAGIGALMVLLEERKRRLASLGYFDQEKKQRTPYLPRMIGVITSPTGAVIRDIIHRISDRFPLHIVIWPVRVQGDGCASEVAAAIRGFNKLSLGGPINKPDVLIIARGGGSLEDLWGYNDEKLVEEIAQSAIPVISAVGHETDWTLVDLVADLRAPTPTGAAEFAVPVKADIEANVAAMAARLQTAIRRLIDDSAFRLRSLARTLPKSDQLFAISRRRFDEASSRLSRTLLVNISEKRLKFSAVSRQLSPMLVSHLIGSGKVTAHNLLARLDFSWLRLRNNYRHTLLTNTRLLKTVSYQSILRRGFTLTFDHQRRPIKQRTAVKENETMTLKFHDGEVAIRQFEQTSRREKRQMIESEYRADPSQPKLFD